MPEEKENATNSRSRKKNSTQENKKDFFTHIIITQIIVVLILSALVFTVRKVSPDSFAILKNAYHSAMEKDINLKEVFINKKSSCLPQGGDDISVFSPQSGTTFSPYYISSEICTPVSGSISSPFGYRVNPVTGEFSFHSGVDIAAVSGEPIKAAYYGIVSEVGYDDTSGNYIVLTHNNSLVTKYLHCSKIIAQEGTVVRSGETIALVGSTGRSTGPHLHFVIEIDGKKTNPLYVMKVNDNKV